MDHSIYTQQKVGWGGYLAFFTTTIFFSDMFAKSVEWWWVFDFTVLNGVFGQINTADGATVSFHGSGGMGTKDGFLFAFELAPSIILSLRIIPIAEGLGGLCAAQQPMTPVPRPSLGIPGIYSLALTANLQNIDAAAGMTKEMAEEGIITEQERAIFACWRTSGSACITNYFSSGAALFTVVTVPVITLLAVILVFKFVGASLLRIRIA